MERSIANTKELWNQGAKTLFLDAQHLDLEDTQGHLVESNGALWDSYPVTACIIPAKEGKFHRSSLFVCCNC